MLCKGVCGEQWADRVYELNRLCREQDHTEPLSSFVSACLRELSKRDWIIVSYSDTAMNHHGYIYQACNFLYTGLTPGRTDMYVGAGKHARHWTDEQKDSDIRQVRSRKHRYVYFCTKDKHLKEQWRRDLKYDVLPYPKGNNNPDYAFGTVLKPTLINKRTGAILGPMKDPGETYSDWLDRIL